MVKFIIVKEGFYPDDIAFLKGNVRAVPDADISDELFETDDAFIPKLELLEEMAFIKIVHQYNSIEDVSDIIRCTSRVEMLHGGSTELRVYILGHIWEFSDSELMGPTAVMKRLLGFKRALHIKTKDWWMILDSWLSRSEDIKEISERDEIIEKMLAYLSRCTIYPDIENAVGRNTLFYDEKDPNVVYCLTNNLTTVCGDSMSNNGGSVEGIGKKNNGGMVGTRRVRWIFNDYIEGASVGKTVSGERNNRFWRIPIEKSGINLYEQMFKEEDDEDGGNGGRDVSRRSNGAVGKDVKEEKHEIVPDKSVGGKETPKEEERKGKKIGKEGDKKVKGKETRKEKGDEVPPATSLFTPPNTPSNTPPPNSSNGSINKEEKEGKSG